MTVSNIIVLVLTLGPGPTWSAVVCGEEPPQKKEFDDLSERLLKKEIDNRDVMTRIVANMRSAEERLKHEYDAGGETQALQQEILEDLDLAIKSASNRSKQRSGQPSKSDTRRKGNPSEQPDSAPQPGASAKSGEPSAKVRPTRLRVNTTGRLREYRRGWGHLPQRDRDAILQGSQEQSVERYRSWIDRYYRALAGEDLDR
jgi:hypothetical protein